MRCQLPPHILRPPVSHCCIRATSSPGRFRYGGQPGGHPLRIHGPSQAWRIRARPVASISAHRGHRRPLANAPTQGRPHAATASLLLARTPSRSAVPVSPSRRRTVRRGAASRTSPLACRGCFCTPARRRVSSSPRIQETTRRLSRLSTCRQCSNRRRDTRRARDVQFSTQCRYYVIITLANA